jgi:uncharacterized protein YcgI (DUF1989 family)
MDEIDALKQRFVNYIKRPDYPCIGAKAAAKKNLVDILVCDSLDSSDNDLNILSAMYKFISNWKNNKESLQTLAVIFKNPCYLNEKEFEQLLWIRLQGLHNLDSEIFTWDPTVNNDINTPQFSFSLGGFGVFIVGMHPGSSRKARQFECPVLVFNLHEQFEKLREEGVFARMRDKIRENDLKFSGSINPMVHNFGESSEALQYSGRKVPSTFHCEFIKQDHTHMLWNLIPPRSGSGFILKKNDLLIVQDVEGEQVSDLFCFSRLNKEEYLSSGKSIDYHNGLLFSTGNTLYSNLSNPMFTIVYDDVARHDFLFAPCNKDTFRIIYGENSSAGCQENIAKALASFGINYEQITTTFNIFMHVKLNASTGKLTVLPPKSKQGDQIIFKAEMDLIVGLTACSAGMSNNYSFKPIHYKILSNNL